MASVTTLPDNKVQTLQFRDPATGQTNTCTNPCPLSTDSSLLYQDFLFDKTLTITGIQIKLSEFTGVGPGLHLLQLLSSGAFASSVDDNNQVSCFAPNPSNTTRTGDWAVKVADTGIAGTIQQVLVSSVSVGTSASAGPSFTWVPYVSASGNYDINLLVPGCTRLLDCPARTTVKITVFPGEGLQPWVSTISQQNTDDANMLIYSGPILPSSNFAATISMTLADSPVGTGQGGKYELVADRVQLILKTVNGTSSNGSGGGGSSDGQGSKSSFGFFEWPRSLTSINATQTLPNSSVTFLDGVGFDLFSGAGGSNGLSFANPAAVASVIHHPSGSIFLGGNFTLSSGAASGSANLVAHTNGGLQRLANNGLNGPVAALVLSGDFLFVGGGFTDTLNGSTSGQLRGIAMYDVQKNTWSPLGAGVDGKVTSLGLADGKVQVAGNFTGLFDSPTDASVHANGFATWDLKTNTWVNSGGFLVGSMTFVGNSTASTQLIAGNVAASQKFGASGMVILKTGDKNGPKITPLGVQLDGNVSGTASGSTSKRRRSHIPRAAAWISHVHLSKLFSRQTAPTQLSPLPPPIPALAPAVLVGAFWTNTSSSAELAIIGGNFSFHSPSSSSALQGVALYDPASAAIHGLNGSQVNGTVRSLLVDGNQLYIGGEFAIQGSNANGLAIYDLARQEWDFGATLTLQPSQGSTVVVRSITKSNSKPNTIIVAGSFAKAIEFDCPSICTYDTVTKQWNKLGNGIHGEVSSVVYAGVRFSDQDSDFH